MQSQPIDRKKRKGKRVADYSREALELILYFVDINPNIVQTYQWNAIN